MESPEAVRVRGLLLRAIEEKGADYIYPDLDHCDYLDRETGQPACIVGHVLIADGMDPEELARREGVAAFMVAPYGEDVTWALDAAQSVQDSGRPWGEALAAYDAYLSARAAES